MQRRLHLPPQLPGRSVKAEQAAVGVGMKPLTDDQRFLILTQCRRGEKRLEVFVPCLLGFPDFFPRIRVKAVEHAKHRRHILHRRRTGNRPVFDA